MDELITIITQASASVTSLIGISALIVVHLASKRLTDGYFKNVVLIYRRFLLLALIGVSSMTVYHFAEESYPDIAEVAESLWYLFMFVALMVTLHGSNKLVALGKTLKM